MLTPNYGKPMGTQVEAGKSNSNGLLQAYREVFQQWGLTRFPSMTRTQQSQVKSGLGGDSEEIAEGIFHPVQSRDGSSLNFGMDPPKPHLKVFFKEHNTNAPSEFMLFLEYPCWDLIQAGPSLTA